MKKRMGIMGIQLVILFLFLAGGILWVNANDSSPPTEVVINNAGYKKDKKGPVKFSHERHVKEHKIACVECHHLYKDGKNVWKEGDPVKKCVECHNPKRKKGQKPMDLMHAYHKNCMGCHKNMAKAGKISRQEFKKLRKCKTCHAKKGL
ncbi:MAG: hypothetical protein DRG39_00040 [Deltaproteobacteria bacterium]|nr:MAG: hypothetical protein DRG39_00040 [Deltaproteobacteria bacterium]